MASVATLGEVSANQWETGFTVIKPCNIFPTAGRVAFGTILAKLPLVRVVVTGFTIGL